MGEDSVTFTLADGTEFTVPLYMGVVDLSAQGTANCYIVSRAGKYRFPAVQGNSSTAVGKYTSASSAEVLWESFGTATAPAVGDLISDVSFSAGYISFTASSRRGNAVIAAKDSYGDILWSWHIWLTERPEDQVYKNNAGTMMDRNLGATSATPGDAAALGLLYQWGRKDPFLGNSSIPDESIPYECIPAVSTNSSIWSITTSTTIDDSVLYPTTFITENANNDDWLYSRSETTDNSRWQPTKTIYDPCPPGYCVPHIYVWHDAFNAASGEIQNIYYFKGIPYNNESKGFNFFKYLTSSGSCWYPLTSIIGPAGVPAQLTRCYYWSSSPNFYYSANYALGCCMSLLSEDAYGDERINPVYAIDRACGLSVRCLKE